MQTSAHLDFAGLADAMRVRARDFVPTWLPGGRLLGKEWVCGSLRGEMGDSFKVNLETGIWADFATDHKGGDLISLYAAIEGLGQGQAARALADKIGFRLTPEKPEPAPAPRIIPPPANAPLPGFRHPRYGQPVKTWAYHDGESRLLFHVARYEPGATEADPTPRKQFLPWCWSSDGKWVMKGYPEPRPLYGLPELAARREAPVLVVEGEKAADAARKLAGGVYVVVTWPNGAKAFDKADWSPVVGRKLLLWPDADEPGRAAMQEIAAKLAPDCPEIKVIDTAGLPDGFDAADFEGDWKALVEWARPRAAKVYALPARVPATMPGDHAEIIEAADFDEPDPSEQIIVATQVNIDTSDRDVIDGSIHALWEKIGVATAQNGNPVCNVDNALRVLEGWPEFKDLVWFDEFHKRYFTRWKSQKAREWTDVDELNLTTFMQRTLQLRRISDDMIHKAAIVYAHGRIKNEPRDWFDSLAWDGKSRIDRFFVDCLGAEEGEYAFAASRNFFVALAARIYRPGCIMRNVVVLEGPQLAGKSTALNLLGGPWYAESAESVTSKDFYLALHGKLIVEIAELDSFSRGEVTKIKQVISCRTDRYRPPYGRASQDNPRMCVFVGTTNESSYLRDNTGGTRFWPIKCGEIDQDAIKEQREQLFAEAVAAFKGGADWYQMPTAATAAAQEERRQIDEWEPIIAEYLLGKDEITTATIATDCLKVEVARYDMMTQRRIGSALRALGWNKTTQRRSGFPGKVWSRDAPF